MDIIETTYKWNGTLSKRSSTDYIILHHRAGIGDVNSIHSGHISQGWSGIGYHLYIRQDGSIYRGRPIDMRGAHCTVKNGCSIGICFEGNFENEKMPDVQVKAGQEVISYLKGLYPNAEIKRHSDFMSTACPGKNFPFDKIKKGAVPVNKRIESPNDIVWELNHSYFPIDDISGFVVALTKAQQNNSPLYWGYYKLVNKIKR